MLLLMLVAPFRELLTLLASDDIHLHFFFYGFCVGFTSLQLENLLFQLCLLSHNHSILSLLRIITVLGISLYYFFPQIISFLHNLYCLSPSTLCILQTARPCHVLHANDLIFSIYLLPSSDDFNLTVNATVSLPSFCPSCCFLLWFSILCHKSFACGRCQTGFQSFLLGFAVCHFNTFFLNFLRCYFCSCDFSTQGFSCPL